MEINDAIRYCPETGNLYWKIDRTGGIKAGDIAGSKGRAGYLKVAIFNKTYQQHRIAWLLYTGAFPKEEIDHINRNRSDNRICNLREVSRLFNSHNQSMRKCNTSGYMGVGLCKQSKKWKANIRRNGKIHYLGMYETPEEAHQKYLDAVNRFDSNTPLRSE